MHIYNSRNRAGDAETTLIEQPSKAPQSRRKAPRGSEEDRESGRVGHSLEVEVLPSGEEDEAVERRGPGEGGDGGEREELERLEHVGDLRHAVARVDAASAQVHPPLRVRPQRVVERERKEHAHGRHNGDHLVGAVAVAGAQA